MSQFSRRQFLKRSSLTAAGFWVARNSFARISPNEKLNIGVIGTHNRAASNISGVASENIVAICDVDDNFLALAQKKFANATPYNDYRKLLEQKNIDAVVVSTPDHTHAVATVAALKSGRHVYCEKPLTHTVSEARIVAETATKLKRVTQMGTQIHATSNYRQVVETIKKGTIGAVREVHVWVDVVYTADGRPSDRPAVPKNLHWDLWLGPAPERPYHPNYVPINWRRWWDFGGGTLSDFGCHYMDLPFWALSLRHPNSVEVEGPPVHPEVTPPWLIAHYEFPARGAQPPVKFTWYHGERDGKKVRPAIFDHGKLPPTGSGVLFVGEKGMLLSEYFKHYLFPEKNSPAIKPPDNNYEGEHHQEWIHAIKTGGKTSCNFDYAGALSEAALLGNAAYRSGHKIIWDAAALKARGNPEADKYIQHQYRSGWSL